MDIELDHYPFRITDADKQITDAIGGKLYFFLNDLFPVKGFSGTTYAFILRHFQHSLSLFSEEERLRKLGNLRANLFYHNKHHALFQATYDGIGISKAILDQRKRFSRYLSTEGFLAIVLAAMYHDTGYVTSEKDPQNYAGLTPIHVEGSKKTFADTINLFGLPEFLNKDKILKLGVIGIHNTYFPYTSERKTERRVLIGQFSTPEERKEAMIVGLAVQLTDLGGQVSRVDYFPNLIKALREEMNCANPGLGTAIIGKDEELETKCKDFTKAVILPTVGKTANAFFGKNNNLSKIWAARLDPLNKNTLYRENEIVSFLS